MNDEETRPPEWLLPDKAYDVLKWLCIIVLPAAATFLLTLGQIWGIPHATEIAASIVGASTFIGAIIGASAIKGGGADDAGD